MTQTDHVANAIAFARWCFDFQNVIKVSCFFRIFGVFSSGFLNRTTVMWLKNGFSHVFLNFNFWPKLTILPKAIGFAGWVTFQNGLISRIFGVFSSGFLHRTTLMWLKNRFSKVFFDLNWPFSRLYDGRFSQIVSFLEYLVFSQAVFCTQTDHFDVFCKAIPTMLQRPLHDGQFSKSSHLYEYLVFSQAVFCTEQL